MEKRTVLIVDDDADIRAFLTTHFESWGFEILTAEDGEQGAAVAIEAEPSLILMDMNMPGVSGFESARKIRGNSGTNETPMLAVTAHDTPGDRDEAHKAGCNAVLAKPIEESKLNQAVTELIGQLHP
jgi:CheY-like chemotaxis protein